MEQIQKDNITSAFNRNALKALGAAWETIKDDAEKTIERAYEIGKQEGSTEKTRDIKKSNFDYEQYKHDIISSKIKGYEKGYQDGISEGLDMKVILTDPQNYLYTLGIQDCFKYLKRIIYPEQLGGFPLSVLYAIFGTSNTYSIFDKFPIETIINKIKDYEIVYSL